MTEAERGAMAVVRDALVASINLAATGRWKKLRESVDFLELERDDGKRVIILTAERPAS